VAKYSLSHTATMFAKQSLLEKEPWAVQQLMQQLMDDIFKIRYSVKMTTAPVNELKSAVVIRWTIW